MQSSRGVVWRRSRLRGSERFRGWRAIDVALAASLLAGVGAATTRAQDFRRGDVNNDGRVSLADANYFALWLLSTGGPAPPCWRAADVDASDDLQQPDAFLLLNHLIFAMPATLVMPFPDCGAGPPSLLPCDGEPACDTPLPPEPGRFTAYLTTRPDAVDPDTAPAEFTLPAGGSLDIPYFVNLKGEAADGQEAQGWSFGIAAEADRVSVALREATLAGIAAYWTSIRGFSRVGPDAAGNIGTAALLNLTKPVTISGSQTVVSGKVRVTAPAGAEGEGTLTLRISTWQAAPGVTVPVEVVTSGKSFAPDVLPLRAHFRIQPGFVRGDSDQDGIVGITDAIRTLEWLFRGGRPPACADAADDNDDGRLDIADPAFTLNCLFVAACRQEPPGCVADTTADALACAGVPEACR
jgi:hypothetical protein